MPDLDWTLSVPLRRSWAEVCRWITSLAGGSSCRGNVGWLDVAASIQLSLRLKRHLKWCATAIRVVITILSVSARRSVELDDDKVVSEYEEDWPEGGIGSAIRVSCPSYLGPSWQWFFAHWRFFRKKNYKFYWHHNTNVIAKTFALFACVLICCLVTILDIISIKYKIGNHIWQVF